MQNTLDKLSFSNPVITIIDVCKLPRLTTSYVHQAWVVQKIDNAIHQINHYPEDTVACFVTGRVSPLSACLYKIIYLPVRAFWHRSSLSLFM